MFSVPLKTGRLIGPLEPHHGLGGLGLCRRQVWTPGLHDPVSQFLPECLSIHLCVLSVLFLWKTLAKVPAAPLWADSPLRVARRWVHTGLAGGFKDSVRPRSLPAKDFHLVASLQHGIPGGPLAVRSGRSHSVKWGEGAHPEAHSGYTANCPGPGLWGQVTVPVPALLLQGF